MPTIKDWLDFSAMILLVTIMCFWMPIISELVRQ